MSRIATGHFEYQWRFIWHKDKLYINLFPAEKDTSSYIMSKLFKTEIANSMIEKKNISDEEEAENLWIFGTSKKRSMLPKSNLYITLSI